MLDSSLIDQLKTVFQKLDSEMEIILYSSTHEKQSELRDMLSGVASTSSFIKLTESLEERAYPEFQLNINNQSSGISFLGVPGGHEFASLILAILNSTGKGKLPDEGIIKRIKNLKGKINLKTFMSLSCENCPEVVQALNLIASINSNVSHQTINGEYVQEEIERLKIQGVPSVLHGEELILSGKNSLADIISRLEEVFGKEQLADQSLGLYDVVVIGGGPAGVSSAIYTSRKGLKTALVASQIGGQLQETKGIENLISVPYTEGVKLSSELDTHLKEYPVKVLEHRLVESVQDGKIKKIILNSGEEIEAKVIIVATGAKWRHLGVPGEKNYLGRGVAFCAHCDGPFYKGKDVVVVGGGNSGVEAAIDLSNIAKSVVLLEYNKELKADKFLVEKLGKIPNARIITEAKTQEIVGDGKKVNQILFQKHNTVETLQTDGVFVQIGLIPNSEFLKGFLETNRFGEILVDNKCQTNKEGVFAAGDVTNVPFKQIVVSLGEGAKAGLTAFEYLVLK